MHTAETGHAQDTLDKGAYAQHLRRTLRRMRFVSRSPIPGQDRAGQGTPAHHPGRPCAGKHMASAER